MPHLDLSVLFEDIFDLLRCAGEDLAGVDGGFEIFFGIAVF